MSSEPEKMPGHWRFPASILRGGESGAAKILRRQSSGKGNIVAAWNLEHEPKGDLLLTLSGWDDEKPGKTRFEVLVNGGKIFSGENTFPETPSLKDVKPGHMAFAIPGKLLVKGENQIEFVNLVQDDPTKTIRALANPLRPEDGFAEREDYFWGWMAINELRLTAIDDQFDKFVRGEKSAWTVWSQHLPQGVIQCDDGMVSISSAGARYTGISVEIKNNRWLLPEGAQFRMRMKASGKGKFTAGLLCYPTDENGARKSGHFWSSVNGDLTAEEKVFEKTVSQQVFGYCCPIVSLVGEGDLKIHELSFIPLP